MHASGIPVALGHREPCEGERRRGTETDPEECEMSSSSLLAKTPRLAAALVVAVLGSVVTASAQLPIGATSSPVSRSQTNERDQPINDDNPCTGEFISGLGKMHTQTIDSSTPTMSKMTFRTHQNGKATGLQTQASYQYQHWAENETQTTATTYQVKFENRKHMIRTGSNAPVDDDFFFRETIVFSVNGPIVTSSVESFKAEDTCK